MIILDATTKNLEVLIDSGGVGTDVSFTSGYGDLTALAFTPGENDLVSAGTSPVNLAVAPGASTQRIVKTATAFNNSATVTHTVTLQINNNGTRRIIGVVRLQPGAGCEIFDAISAGSVGIGNDMLSPALFATVTKTGNPTLTIADAATWLRAADASAQTFTLPAANAVPAGTKFAVYNDSAINFSAPVVHLVNPAGADTIFTFSGAATSQKVRPGAMYVFESDGTSKWLIRVRVQHSDMLSQSQNATVTKTGNPTLTVADAAMWLRLADGSAQTATLPAANTLIAGQKIAVFSDSTVSGSAPIVHTLQRAGSDTIVGDTGALTSLALLSGNFVVLESDGISKYYMRDSRFNTGWLDGGAVTITGSSSNPTKGTTTYDHAWWRRVGHDIEFRLQFKQTGAGANGSGNYQFTIPGGFTADTNFMQVTEDIGLGSGYAQSTAGGATTAVVNTVSGSPTKLLLQYQSTIVSTLTTVGAGNFKLGDATAIFYLHGFLPITGWAT